MVVVFIQAATFADQQCQWRTDNQRRKAGSGADHGHYQSQRPEPQADELPDKVLADRIAVRAAVFVRKTAGGHTTERKGHQENHCSNCHRQSECKESKAKWQTEQHDGHAQIIEHEAVTEREGIGKLHPGTAEWVVVCKVPAVISALAIAHPTPVFVTTLTCHVVATPLLGRGLLAPRTA